MPIAWSTKKALDEFDRLIVLGKKPAFEFPAFILETEFLEFFAEIIEQAPEYSNIVPFMDQLIDKVLEESIFEICRVLNKYKVDGTTIFGLMAEKKLILTGVRKTYNKQVWGKSPKGLRTEPWNTYNNWLLAEMYWKALIQSYDPGFKLDLKQDNYSKSALKALKDPRYRPLWAMKQAFIEASEPAHGYANEDIFIRPIAEWYGLKKNSGFGKFVQDVLKNK
jgi:hypothetical protein